MALNEVRGEWVVGLNPDDRMPNDWLRMVARVFAAYRKLPLKDSIVAYIDGLNLSLTSHINSIATVDITPGQAFVDDQFIGFTEISQLQFDTTWLVPGNDYCIVLFYRWVNQMPPEEPHFDLVKKENVNPEEMLCLGTARCTLDQNNNCILEIIDDKDPWYRELINEMVGNTEVDGADQLPYIVSIKAAGDGEYPDDPDDSEGTIDIGWAVDFHHYVGNHVNKDLRLHTDRVNNDTLYINNNKVWHESNLISTGLNIMFVGYFSSDPTQRPDGSSLEDGDVYYNTSESTYFYYKIDTWRPIGSGSGIGNLNRCEIIASEGQTNVPCNYNPNAIWVYLDGVLVNIDDYQAVDGLEVIFNKSLNGEENITILSITDTTNFRRCEVTAVDGQITVDCNYNPNAVWVHIDGIFMQSNAYQATNGTQIIFNNSLKANEIVSILTITDSNSISSARTNVITQPQNNIPEGGIIMWAGLYHDVPDGWILCDGNNATPDLRSNFILNPNDSSLFELAYIKKV